MEVVNLKLKEVRPYENNPRHNEEAVGLVADCIEISDLTEEQQNAFRIADNRVADFSFWDNDLLQQEMIEIGADDWELFGFKEKDLGFLNAPDQCTCPKCGKTFIKV